MEIQLSPRMETALDNFVQQGGRSREEVVEDALSEYLCEEQDAVIALDRLNQFRAGESHLVSLEDVMDQHGVER